MRIKSLFLALMALPLFFVACDKGNDTVDTPKDATVTITAGSFTESEISFTIASTNAEKVAYIVIEAAEEAPMASEVLANGVVIDANKSVECTKGELKAETTYTIIAVAQNSKGVDKKSIEMTTLQGTVTPGPDPTPDPTPETFVATNYYAEFDNSEGINIYCVMLGDKEIGDEYMGVDGGTYYTFYFISSTIGGGKLPNGIYTLDSTYGANTIIADFSYRHQMENGELVNGMEIFSDANLTISDGKIEAQVVLDRDGSIHHVVFEGELAVEDGGNDEPLEFEATHTADKWLWGGSSNYGNKYQVVGEGFSVDVHLQPENATEEAIVAGEYIWSTTTMWGYNDFEEFTTRTLTVDGTSVAVDAGILVVSNDGEEYHIEMTLEGRDGFVYMIQYDGKINDKGEVGGDENATIVFTNFEYVTYNSSAYFFEYKLTNEAGDSLILDVNDYSANESTIYPGSYTWYTRSYCGNQGLFSTNTIKVAGISYKASAGTLVVADKATLDLTITLTMESGDEMTFTYAAPENGGNEGGNEGGSTELVKLATPSVSGVVAGNAVTISWQMIDGAKDYTVTLNGTDVKTVETAYVVYQNLEWETTYSVSVVANPADAAVNAASDAGTTSFTTEANPNEGGNEGGDEEIPSANTTLKYVKNYGSGYDMYCYYELTSGNDIIGFWIYNDKSDKSMLYDGTFTNGTSMNHVAYYPSSGVFIEDVTIDGKYISRTNNGGSQTSSTIVVTNGNNVTINLDYVDEYAVAHSCTYTFNGTIN
ncbi:MAG: hypothetical protein J6V05_01780 [Alistipes sp.]|nr:hypothetical protein [Alistipes sp.]